MAHVTRDAVVDRQLRASSQRHQREHDDALVDTARPLLLAHHRHGNNS
jgi:hypothetical protein